MPAAKLPAKETNSPKVHRLEGYRRPAVHLPSYSSPAVTAALPALASFYEHVAKTNISRPHPLTPCALCTAPTAREVGVEKPLHSPVRGTCARATCFHVSRAKLPRGVSYVSPLLLAFFSRACSPPPGCFLARYYAHLGGWAPSFGR
jgi:hypothetical protein